MYAAVELLYREGRKTPPQYPPLIGQVISDHERGRDVLRLWPLDWVHNTTTTQREPLAVLWRPILQRIGYSDLLISGLEPVGRNGGCRWCAQTWICAILTAEGAANFFKWDEMKGKELPSSMPPSPPPLDPDRPFD